MRFLPFLFLFVVSFSVNAQPFQYQQNAPSETYAGFYLKIPFGSNAIGTGNLKLRYGLSLDYRRTERVRQVYAGNKAMYQTHKIRFADLSFTETGFSKLSLSSLPILRRDKLGNMIFLNDDKGDKSMIESDWVFYPVAAIGALTIIAAVVGN